MTFITLEGPEGSGKTSHLPGLAKAVREAGFEVVVTREPGGTPIGDEIRNTILKLENTEMHATTEILLFQSSRAQLVNQVIRPALAEGKIVICDRYADSTMAYQGYGHQTDLAQLTRIIDFATGGLTPDLTILLDLDILVGLKRRSSDDENWNRLDAKEIEFHQRVRKGYHLMREADPERWASVNAEQDLEKVKQDLIKVVIDRLKKES